MAEDLPTRTRSEKAPLKEARAHLLNHWSLLRERRHMHLFRAALVGIAAGSIAVLYQMGIERIQNLYFDLRLHLLSLGSAYPLLLIPLGAILSALACELTMRYAPEASGSGIPHVKAVLLHLRTLRWYRVLPVKYFAGLLAIGGGLAVGREGPTVQMGAAAANMVSHWLRVPRRSRSQLIAAGAGAGLAAAFNAPLAGFIFTIEELQREMSPLTYSTALIAAVLGDVVTRWFTAGQPTFHVTGFRTPDPSLLYYYVIIGCVAALVGCAFNRSLLWSLRATDELPFARWKLAAVIGGIAGLVAWWCPDAIGTGQMTAQRLLSGAYNSPSLLIYLALLFAIRFVLTMASYSTRVPGGIFASLLILGSLLGIMVGQVVLRLNPQVQIEPEALAVAGMAAVFAATIRAPLTGIVLVLEMTSNYEQLLGLLIAGTTAFVLADRYGGGPIYEELLDLMLRGRQSKSEEITDDEPYVVTCAVEPDSDLDGSYVRDLGLPTGALLITVRRGGRDIIPSGATRLQKGDELQLVYAASQLPNFVQLRNRSIAPRPQAVP